ncbi:MAG: hypothetical protein JNN15_16600 [Blastocatellia bacterium]|nr:hypothetical protein [Blastocatellia bacterium]
MSDVNKLGKSSPEIDRGQNSLNNDKDLSASFDGRRVSAINAPEESPIISFKEEKSAERSSAVGSKNGYRVTERPSFTVNRIEDSALFDHATGRVTPHTSQYIESNPAAKRTVEAFRQAVKEIGSPDFEPKLDPSTEAVLKTISKSLFQKG